MIAHDDNGTQQTSFAGWGELAGRCMRPEPHALLARMKRAGIGLTAITDEHPGLIRWMTVSGHRQRDALSALQPV